MEPVSHVTLPYSQEQSLCQCGCGLPVRKSNRFINHHNLGDRDSLASEISTLYQWIAASANSGLECYRGSRPRGF
jgi:hypothetical protein